MRKYTKLLGTILLLSALLAGCGALVNDLPEEERAAQFGMDKVTVGRVVDGDTFVDSAGRKIRLIGINTPESTNRIEDYGQEASEYAKTKLTGKQVWLQRDVSNKDKYGRLLRFVWMEVPEDDENEEEVMQKMFNADLVINGYAEPSTYTPDVKWSDLFRNLAKDAREQEKGLWSFGPEGTTRGDLDYE
ncbi:MAG: thermonuclease family protein [Bacillus sp. (in: firmicutes)]